jgi:hypothetical protein
MGLSRAKPSEFATAAVRSADEARHFVHARKEVDRLQIQGDDDYDLLGLVKAETLVGALELAFSWR